MKTGKHGSFLAKDVLLRYPFKMDLWGINQKFNQMFISLNLEIWWYIDVFSCYNTKRI